MNQNLLSIYTKVEDVENAKSFPSHMAHWAALISVSYNPQPDTGLHCTVITDTGLVHRAVCLSQLSLVGLLIAPTHGGMARLS